MTFRCRRDPQRAADKSLHKEATPGPRGGDRDAPKPDLKPICTLCQSWTLEVFLNFFNNKKGFFCIFYQVNNTIPISAPVLFKKPTPSQINLIKNAKNHFLILKKLENTESAQLCTVSTA